MPVGVNNFERIKAEALKWRPQSAERAAWVQVFLSLLTQASSTAAFPSYNVVLGFWGLYSVFTRSLQATNVYVWLLCFSILLDIIFCSIWGSNDTGVFDGSTTTFCLVMLIFNMAAKTVSAYSFFRYHKELESGAIRPYAASCNTGLGAKQGRNTDSGACDMAPMSSQKERAPIESPTASVFSGGSAASFALSPKGRGA